MSDQASDSENETQAIEVMHVHDERFCGRCQSRIPNTIELHVCKKAPRLIGYAWYEPDEPAIEKNAIIQYSKPFKRGDLIKEFPAEKGVGDERSTA